MIRTAARRAVLACAVTVAAGLAVPAPAAAAPQAAPPAAPMAAPMAAPPAAPRPDPTVTVTGTYARLAKDHLDADGGLRHEYEDVLRVPGKAIRLRLPRGHALKPGSKVQVSALDSGGGTLDVKSYQRLAPAALPPAGVTTVIVILAYWTKPDSVTQASATSKVFGDAHNWFKEVSYGKAGLSGVVTPWVRIMPPPTGRCYADSEEILGQARQKAGLLGGRYVPSQYQRTIVYFPRCSGGDTAGVAGWAYEPGDSAWLNGYLDRRTTVHEQGHNHGLGHARSLTCTTPGGARTTFSKSCTSAVYGDPYDAMGRSTYAAHYTGFRKDLLGWLGSRKRVLTSTSSTFTLPPFEKPSSLPNVVVAQSNRVAGRSYWLEYRRPVGMDARLPAGATGGVLVHLQEPGRPGWLLDGTPSDGTFSTAVIKAGRSWTSPDYVKISVGSISSTGARVTVTGARAAPVVPSAPRNLVVVARDGSASLSWSAPLSDGRSPITEYVAEFTRSTGGSAVAQSASPDERSMTADWLTNGTTYTVKFFARNAVGDSPPLYATVKPYAMPPTVRLVSPAAGATVRGPLTFQATATPHAVTQEPVTCVRFLVDEAVRTSDCDVSDSTFAATWSTGKLANGTHQVRVVATDAAGRTASAGPVDIVVDNPAPEVKWVTPGTGAVVDGDTVPLEVAVTIGGDPAAQVSEVRFYDRTNGTDQYIGGAGNYYDPDYYYWMTNTALQPPYRVNWPVTYLNGKRTVVAQVRDVNGILVRSTPVEITINHPPPTIAITSPAAGSEISGTATTVKADVVVNTPGAAVDFVRFTAGHVHLGDDRTAPYEVPWDISSVSGYVTVAAAVHETSGRGASASPVRVRVANVLPALSVTHPTGYDIGPVVHQFRGTARAGTGGEAPDRVVLKVGNEAPVTATPAADGTWSHPWDAANKFGYHPIEVKAYTSGGLVTTWRSYFYVVHPRPTVTLHSPAMWSLVPGDTVAQFVLSATPRSDDPTTVASVCVRVHTASGCATAPGADGRYTVPLTMDMASGYYYPDISVTMSDGYRHGFSSSYFYLARVPRAPVGVTATGGPGALTVAFTPPPATEPVSVSGYVLTVGDRTMNITATTYVVRDLVDGTAYDVSVRAVNSVGTGPAAATTGQPGAAVSLGTTSAPPYSVIHGSPASWTVRLADPAGALVAGRTVVFDACADPVAGAAEGVCTEVGTGTTKADGSVTVAHPLTAVTTYRARFAGDATYGSTTLRSPLILITPRLTLTMTPTTVAHSGTLELKAELAPAGHGYVYLEYRGLSNSGYWNGRYLGWMDKAPATYSLNGSTFGVGTFSVRVTMYDYTSGQNVYSPEQTVTVTSG